MGALADAMVDPKEAAKQSPSKQPEQQQQHRHHHHHHHHHHDGGKHKHGGAGSGKRLVLAEAIHYDMRYPFVHDGYRAYTDSVREAFWSMFELHNQTINTWTHLLGGLYFLWRGWDVLTHFSALGGDTADFWAFGLFIACAMFQMFSSAAFHLFGSMNPDTFNRVLSIDMLGIIAMVIGSYGIGLHNGFGCPHLRSLFVQYFTTACVLLATTGALILSPSLKCPDWLRNTCFVVSIAFGVLPTAHWVLFLDNEKHLSFLWAVGLMFGCYGLGFLFFTTRFPERLAPGRFDIFGASHQWWHVFVWAAGAAWCEGMAEFAVWRMTHPAEACPGAPAPPPGASPPPTMAF